MNDVKTHFKGPGQWRSQAAALEAETVTASAHWHASGGIEFACHDASCRPPTSGGTGGSRPGGGFPNGANPEGRYLQRLRAIGITDPNNIGPEYKDKRDEQLAHNFRSSVAEDLHGLVRVRVGAHHIEEILADGLKTQHETGTSGGMFSPVRRDAHEAVMFDAPNTRPIYGYVKTIEPSDAPGLSVGQYGAFSLVMKDSVSHRTTSTYGDSLGSEDFPVAPISVHDLHSASTMRVAAAVVDRQGDKVRYIEAQIHGGVKPSDIDHIEFDPHEDADRIARVRLAAEAHGIPMIEPTQHYTGPYGDDEVHFGAEDMKLIAVRDNIEAWANEPFEPELDDVTLRSPGKPDTVVRWQSALKFGYWEKP